MRKDGEGQALAGATAGKRKHGKGRVNEEKAGSELIVRTGSKRILNELFLPAIGKNLFRANNMAM
jgi:hypothetical protein